MKKYVIFAGVNGAGKSTLYQTNESVKNLPRINVDETVREIGDWRNPKDVYIAARTTVKKLKKFFDNNESINQETTLCGKTIIKNIQSAKNNGYKIEIYYIGLSSVELAKERVRIRVKAGGHGIPDKDIERRYYESIENLKTLLPICDIVEIYDNSIKLSKIAVYANGKSVYISKDLPEWFRSKFIASDYPGEK